METLSVLRRCKVSGRIVHAACMSLGCIRLVDRTIESLLPFKIHSPCFSLPCFSLPQIYCTTPALLYNSSTMDPPGTATGHYCRRSRQLHLFATDNAKYCEYCSSQLPSSTAATSSGGEDEGNPPISLLFNRTRLPQAVHSPFSVEFRASSAAIDRDATPSLQSSESIPNLTLPKQSQHRAVFPIGQSTKSRAASTSSKLYPEARGVAERHRSAKAQAIRPQAPQAP